MRILSVVIMTMVLAACSSSVAVNYYQLSATASTASEQTAKPVRTAIFLQPVQVASYLNSKSIIMQMSAVELVLARQHLWAEPLDQQIQRKLANSLEATNPGDAQGFAIALEANTASVLVTVHVEQFHGTADGLALFKGRYSISKDGGTGQSFNFSYQLPLQADGYSALVLSLSQAVEQLAATIQQQLSKSTR
jgi:uncharacterized protein